MSHDYWEQLYRLLSKEYNCAPEDFSKQENILNSWNIAQNCGFRPAWVEIGAEKKK
jgi:hypothetical protein